MDMDTKLILIFSWFLFKTIGFLILIQIRVQKTLKNKKNKRF